MAAGQVIESEFLVREPVGSGTVREIETGLNSDEAAGGIQPQGSLA